MTWTIASYNSMPSGNSNINGINIAEGCSASGINDAIRQLMADLASPIFANQVSAQQFDGAGGAAVMSVFSVEKARFVASGLLVGTTSLVANMDAAGGQIGATRGFFSGAGQGMNWDAATSIQGTGSSHIDVLVNAQGVTLINGSTSWAALSDIDTKTDLVPIEAATDKVSTLRAVTGRYKTDDVGVSRSFLIAQDVQTVLPEAVGENPDGTLALRYTEVIPLLVAAIKEQAADIAALNDEVASLKLAA